MFNLSSRGCSLDLEDDPTWHLDMPKIPDLQYCAICNRPFVGRAAYNSHCKDSPYHQSRCNTYCKRCKKYFQSPTHLKKHLGESLAHWRCQRDPTKGIPCDYDAQTWLELCHHWDQSKCQYYCSNCGTGWLSRAELSKHRNECICRICSKHCAHGIALEEVRTSMRPFTSPPH